MIVTGLDGREYKWSLGSHIQKFKSDRPQSALHVNARSLLTTLYPCDRILEEVKIPGSPLYIDIYIPLRHIAIEVQGEQHFKFNRFFYKNKLSFFKAQQRDRDKKHFCEINKITLIELPFNESVDDWKRRITSST